MKNKKDNRIDDYSDDEVVEELTPKTEIPLQRDFYKIPPRFGSIPVDKAPLGIDPEKQYFKLFPRIALPFQKAHRVSFGHPKLEPNRLFWGDNLHVMRMLPSNSIDLIYIDPPFFSNANYNVLFGDQNEVRSFSDIWKGGMPSYLIWLNARLLEMKRLLKPTGSLYVHLDWHASHYVKIEMDKIFGYDNFKNNIVWCYKTRQFSKRYWNKKHDDILFYTKGDEYTFNWDDPDVLEPYAESTVKKYKSKDEKGHYRLCGRGIKGSPIKSAKDVDPKWEKTNPELVVRNYLGNGYAPSDYFNIDIVNQVAHERIGYPTQKPEELIKKIILASSKPNDVVADFFCGGGTLPTTAQKLGRKWIGCDQSRVAVAITQSRIESLYEKSSGTQQTLKPIPDISVEYWGTYEIPALEKLDENDFRNFVIAAYGGRPSSAGEYIHGYKLETPLFVGTSKQNQHITKNEVLNFAQEIAETKGKHQGTMFAWSFAPSAKIATEKLMNEGDPDVNLIQISLTEIESSEFRKNVIKLDEGYESFLKFIIPPEVLVSHKRVKALTYEFDASESIELNIGSKIVNIQWDFDYTGRFTPTKGFAYGRENEKPLSKVKYKFEHLGKTPIACRVQDDVGGEKIYTEIISVS